MQNLLHVKSFNSHDLIVSYNNMVLDQDENF